MANSNQSDNNGRRVTLPFHRCFINLIIDDGTGVERCAIVHLARVRTKQDLYDTIAFLDNRATIVQNITLNGTPIVHEYWEDYPPMLAHYLAPNGGRHVVNICIQPIVFHNAANPNDIRSLTRLLEGSQQ